MAVSGSEIIVNFLLEQEVDTVFGYPGGANLPLYDALYDSPLKHVLTIHEQGAAHAADGYARASGRTGVCMATSGPGATNLLTGLAAAFMDSSPVVAITGQVSTGLLGRDSFQEIDITGMTMPITKYNFLVKNVHDLPDILNQAFTIAVSGRPGPVLVDIPRDVLLARTQAETARAAYRASPGSQAFLPDKNAMAQAVAVLTAARRPVMIIGGGAVSAGARQEILDFMEAYPLPVVSTLMGLGAGPAGHPGYLGLTGMHGHKAANSAVAEADVIIAAGARFSERTTGCPQFFTAGKTIIHLDIDPAEFNKNISASISLEGSLAYSLRILAAGLRNQHSQASRTGWLERTIDRQRQFAAGFSEEQLNVPWIMKYMSKAVAGQPVIWVTDVGQHQMWAAQHLGINRISSWLTSGGMGAMGFGLPAALGAQTACPDKRVILIAGDGGFKMTGVELYTAVSYKLPVISVVVNNRALGMVRQLQHLFCRQRYSATLLPDFDFAGFARACGACAFEASTAAEFKAAFAWALNSSGPTVIVVAIDRDLLVEPTVAPGSPINKFMEV